MRRKTRRGIDAMNTVLDFIMEFKTNNDGVSPTIREIMKGCGIRSSGHVVSILDDLKDAGDIVIKTGARNIRVVGGSWQFFPFLRESKEVDKRERVV